MKIDYIILVLLFMTISVFAQKEDSLLDYYPLHLGNYWEYEGKAEHFLEDTTVFNYYSLEVIGDTIMPNSENYQILLKKSIPDSLPHEIVFERIDSTSFNIYRYIKGKEILIDSLKMILTGGMFEAYSRYHNQPNTTISFIGSEDGYIFNAQATLEHFHARDIILAFGYEYWFAKNLGLVKGFIRETVSHYSTTLVNATINGIYYGHPIKVETTKSTDYKFALNQNYPNPFNLDTKISYELPGAGLVQMNLYNILGQKMENLINEFHTSGKHQINLDGNNLNSGLYVVE
ncbi:MAG: T9SS type A sorting domain-containing protein, partial [Tissierellales bacterium]|nr:T9SS type A sorting domain-containing protein [Tissierellales bacterium]